MVLGADGRDEVEDPRDARSQLDCHPKSWCPPPKEMVLDQLGSPRSYASLVPEDSSGNPSKAFHEVRLRRQKISQLTLRSRGSGLSMSVQ